VPTIVRDMDGVMESVAYATRTMVGTIAAMRCPVSVPLTVQDMAFATRASATATLALQETRVSLSSQTWAVLTIAQVKAGVQVVHASAP
jgi:hypothetical protein